MKILSAEQIRQWDQYTIEQEAIPSVDLMERAGSKCTEWITTHYPAASVFRIFCGKGNNGGDGLAIARMLMERNQMVSVYILEFGHKGTNDFQVNLARLHAIQGNDIHFIQGQEHFPLLSEGEIIIDALFGSGLNRQLEGITAALVTHINNAANIVIAIDIPSGLSTDHSSKDNTVIQATHTLSFQCYKPAFLVAENAAAIGSLHILDIGLAGDYYQKINTAWELTDVQLIHSIYKKRKDWSHKGNFGHALLLAGSRGKMGAAILAAKACLHAGAGLLTVHVPAEGLAIMQVAFPEAMVETDVHPSINTRLENDIEKYDSVGIGPGIGTNAETLLLVQNLFEQYNSPLVIDADALNCLALNKDLLSMLPTGSVLTPHPKEFDRLFGETANDYDRIALAEKKATELNCIIVLKGHRTCIAFAGGKTYFNSTGNAGMATAGSGDVLTGIITALLAQGYSSIEAAILGVYLHGLSGDFASKESSMESMLASDIISKLGAAFRYIQDTP